MTQIDKYKIEKHLIVIFDNNYTPYSKMAANKLFFCLHVN